MSGKLCSPLLDLAASAILLTGCAVGPKAPLARQTGESVVFIGEEPAALAHLPVRGEPLEVRDTYLPASNSVRYIEGRDFVVDYAAGTLKRLPDSWLPDFRTNMLYGQENFDHTQFPGYGNSGYFAFVDYTHAAPASWPDLIYWQRWADALQRKHPDSRITAVNGATGGDSTAQGLERLQTKVLDEKPDLVLLGFGMNDHNVMGVPIPQFESNLIQMITRIRTEVGAEVILFSTFPPNPKWKFGSHRMEEYAAATRRVARETACAYADVFGNWQALAGRKKPEDLLGNNINHPNDFGHGIYFQVFEALGL
jgi:lysophospholipase L1-like esterase